MQRKITVNDLTSALVKYDQDRTYFQWLILEPIPIQKLRELVKKIQTRRTSAEVESKEDYDPLFLDEVADLREIINHYDADESIFVNLKNILVQTHEFTILSKYDGVLLLDAGLFPQDQFKTIENLTLMSDIIGPQREQIKKIFKILDELGILTAERYQLVLKTYKDENRYCNLEPLIKLFAFIKNHFKEDEVIQILKSMDIENVYKNANFILKISQVANYYIPLLPQILKHAAFFYDFYLSFALKGLTLSPEENCLIANKLWETPQHIRKISAPFYEVAKSKIDWKKLSTDLSEVLQLLADNPDQAKEISDAIVNLHYRKNYEKSLCMEYKHGDILSLLQPKVFQAIKQQPKYAGQLCTAIKYLDEISLPYNIASKMKETESKGRVFTETNLDVLYNHPQYSNNLAKSINSLYLNLIYCSRNLSYLNKYPEYALELTQLFIEISHSKVDFSNGIGWIKPPAELTLLTDDILRLLEPKIKNIKHILQLIMHLKEIYHLNQNTLTWVLNHAEYAEQINKIFALDDFPHHHSTDWQKNFDLFCQRPDLLDEFYAVLAQKKADINKKGYGFIPGNSVEDFLRFRVAAREIEIARDSRLHRFFGVQRDAAGLPARKNHPLQSPNVVNLIRKFLTG